METSAIHHAPSTISRGIDQGRLHNQWNIVVKMLEELARTCDIGAARLDVDAKQRTYFWTVWAEVLLELDHDYPKAMLCIGKAIELNHDALEWRIIFVRLLLQWTSPILFPGFVGAPFSVSHKGNRPMSIPKDLESNIPSSKQTNIFQPSEVLADVLKEFPPGEQQIILEQFPVDSLQNESAQAVLFALSILPLQSRQQCCHDILFFIREKDWKSLRLKSSLTFIVYLMCIDALKMISCDEIYETIYIETINEYIMYLQIDAVIAKSIMYEALGEYTIARDNLCNLIYNVLPESDADIDTLKLSFQESILYAICRLPLLEKLSGMDAASISSFKRCVSNHSVVKDRIPMTVRSALTFSTAVLLLNRAKSVSSEEDESTDLADALSLLEASQQILEDRGPSPKPMEHLAQSLVQKLPWTLSSPESIINFATPGRVAILMSAISKRGGEMLPNSIKLLEWSINFEVQLDIEILWAMAEAYSQEGDQEKAISLYQQAHDVLILPKEAICAHDNIYTKQENEFSELVSWLSTGPHPSKYPWLPTIRAASICIDRLCDPKRAIAILTKHMKDLHPNKFDTLKEIKSMFNIAVKNVDPVLALMFELAEEGENMPDEDSDVDDDADDLINDSKEGKDEENENASVLDEIIDPSFKETKKQTDKYFEKLGVIDDSGFVEIVFEMGRAYATASRSLDEKKSVCRNYRKGALMFFSHAMKHYDVVVSPNSYPEKLFVEFACASAEEGMLEDAKKIVKRGIELHEASSRLLHLYAILHSSVAGYDEDINFAINICNDLFTSKSSMNVGLTLALLKWTAGEKESCVNLIEKLVDSLENNMNDSKEKRYSRLSEEAPPKNIIFDEYVLDWDRSPQALRLSTEIFVTASNIYRQCGMLENARYCTDLAWKLLHTVNGETICGLDFQDDEDRAELLRRLPQSSGWRLRDACGWGAVRIVDCEAEIIAEYAAQYMAEHDLIKASEMYKVALMEFPYHIPSLMALAEIELSKCPGYEVESSIDKFTNGPDFKLFCDDEFSIDNDLPIDGNGDLDDATIKPKIKSENGWKAVESVKGVARAIHYASLAVRFEDEISETWYVAGKAYEALTCKDEAKVAFWKALELGNEMVVRQFRWALMDT